jgi:tetratricopeptide (TPR) repeat protein
MQTSERPVLVGRSAELAEWARMLSALPARGDVFCVGGEAGIGKTRLAAEFARMAAEAGARILRGGARESTRGTAYAPLVEALIPLTRTGATVAADLADPYRSALGLVVPDWRRPDGDGDGLVVAEGVVRLLSSVAGTAGTVLIIEDTQWADPDTLAVLDHLTRAASTVPVLLMTTTRVDQTTGAPTAAVPHLLDRLDDAQQHAMINAVLGDVPEEVSGLVRDRAEGLPLAVEEIIADLVRIGGLQHQDGRWICRPDLVAEATAPTFDAMVGDRLTGLPAEALSAATAAALLDDVVSWREVGPIAGLDADTAATALAGLADAQLLTGAGRGRFRYRHGLVRDAVLDWVPPSLVGETAQRAARRLQDTGDPSDHATAARLFELAGSRAEAAQQYVEAARQWLAIGALRSAESAAHDAMRLTDTAPAPAAAHDAHLDDTASTRADVAVLRLSGSASPPAEAGAHDGLRLSDAASTSAEAADVLADALVRMGRFAEALTVDTAAGERAGPRAAVAHCRAARCALETGDRVAAREHLDLAEQCGGAAGEVTALRAALALETGDHRAAAELAAQAVGLAETAAGPELLCSALLVAARVARSGDPDDSRPGLERMYDTAVAYDLPEWRERALLDLGLLDRITTGRPERLQLVRKEADERGSLHTLAVAELNLWPMLLDTGDIDEAQRVCDHAALISSRYDLRISPIATAMQAMLAAMRGRADVAPDIADRIHDHLPARTNVLLFEALSRADPDAALAVLDRVADRLNADLTARPAGPGDARTAVRHPVPGPAPGRTTARRRRRQLAQSRPRPARRSGRRR